MGVCHWSEACQDSCEECGLSWVGRGWAVEGGSGESGLTGERYNLDTRTEPRCMRSNSVSRMLLSFIHDHAWHGHAGTRRRFAMCARAWPGPKEPGATGIGSASA